MVLSAILLGSLALIDGAFAGFRMAAGRSPFLVRTDETIRAMWLGVALSVLNVALAAGCIAALVATSDKPDAQLAVFVRWAEHLVLVYGSYATLVLVTMAIWTYPSTQARILASTMVLGPCTLIRPWFIVAGGIVAGTLQPRAEIVFASALVVCLQLGSEAIMNRLHDRAQREFIETVRTAARRQLPRNGSP